MNLNEPRTRKTKMLGRLTPKRNPVADWCAQRELELSSTARKGPTCRRTKPLAPRVTSDHRTRMAPATTLEQRARQRAQQRASLRRGDARRSRGIRHAGLGGHRFGPRRTPRPCPHNWKAVMSKALCHSTYQHDPIVVSGSIVPICPDEDRSLRKLRCYRRSRLLFRSQ
jgi:hypothetical protein